MEIELTPEQKRYVESKVQAGEYASIDAVICRALQLVARDDQRSERRLQRLRRGIQRGLDDLDHGRHSPRDEAFAQLRAERRKGAD